MSPLVLTLREEPRQRVDMSRLSPDLLSGLKPEHIAAIEISCGNRQVSLGGIFDIEGSDPQQLRIRNSWTRLDGIGSGMKSGSIRVEGNCGDYLGQDMQDGRIEVTGNSGHWTATGMHGGMIGVAGHCGDFAGAALPGDRQGMRGGTLLVQGNAGDRTGDHLRRGTILIAGDTGACCGARMIAGTIVVLGKVGPRPGYAMMRGTLIVNHLPEDLPPAMNDCGEHTLGFLPLLLASYSDLDSRFLALASSPPRVRRFCGDLANDGKGELLVRV